MYYGPCFSLNKKSLRFVLSTLCRPALIPNHIPEKTLKSI